MIFNIKNSNIKTMTHRSKLAISELPCASVSERVFVQNLSYENEFICMKTNQ